MSTATSSLARCAIALAVFVAIGAAVFVAERLIEASDPDLLWRDPASGDDGLKFYRFDPVLGLFHKPGFAAEYQGVRYTTNALGLRGPETGHARTPNRRRVVLLGDSVVWGFGVPDGETLADALAEAWRPTEVLNLGVAGYGTGQELMLLRHAGLAYEPDRVLLVFTLANDVEDTYFPDSAASFPANLFRLVEGRLEVDRFVTSWLERLALALNHRSFVVNYVARAAGSFDDVGVPGEASADRSATGRANRARLLAHQPDLARYAELHYLAPEDGSAAIAPHYAKRGGLLRPDPLNYYKVELVKQVLLELARTSREHGAQFAVVLAPYAAQLSSKTPPNPLNRELSRFLSEAGIPVVDLLPLLRARALPTDSLYIDGVHFSTAGNRVVADLIARELPEPGRP